MSGNRPKAHHVFQVIDRGMCRRSPAMAIMPFEPARENVRFGSKADIGKGATDLRFTLKADIARWHREVCCVPESDIHQRGLIEEPISCLCVITSRYYYVDGF